MRSRNRLHKSKLQDFKEWLETKDWTQEQKRGNEVLRMKHPTKGLLFVHERHRSDHYTTWGTSDRMFSQWRREFKEAD